MFENLTVIIVIVVVLWLVGFGVYLHSSRQQQDLATQIDDLKAILDAQGKDAKN